MSFKSYLDKLLDEVAAANESPATKQSAVTFIIGRIYEYLILQPEIERLEHEPLPPKIIQNIREYAYHELLKAGIDKELALIVFKGNL